MDWAKPHIRGLEVLQTPDFTSYQDFIKPIAIARDSAPFVIGDWVIYGEQAFGEAYAQALSVFGEYAYGSIANYASVMRKVPFKYNGIQHREDYATYTHHKVVSKYDLDQQRYWLSRTVKDSLRTFELKKLLKEQMPLDQIKEIEPELETPTTELKYPVTIETALMRLLYEQTKLAPLFMHHGPMYYHSGYLHCHQCNHMTLFDLLRWYAETQQICNNNDSK